MSAAQKLTKKQKKALAFRERKTGKGKDDAGDVGDNDVPVMEIQDMADLPSNEMEVAPVGEEKTKPRVEGSGKDDVKAKGKGKAVESGAEKVVDKPKKRKRDAVDVEMGGGNAGQNVGTPKQKKPRVKADDGGPETVAKDGDRKVVEVKQRFILFVGNLKYTTSQEAIKAHFAICDPPPSIRLLTPKPNSSQRTSNKSKGCAFLEFSHRNALQQALKLHQSDLDGRMINVELTAGGGGKSDSRITKLKERNKELFTQRKQRIEKEGLDGESIPSMPDRPQRYSATSGIEQAPVVRRTWTVGNVEDDGPTHRGGKRHSKPERSRRSGSKIWGTGVNAIPVG